MNGTERGDRTVGERGDAPESLATRAEVAERLGVPATTLAQWAHRGEGPEYIRVGRHARYDWGDVASWLAQRPRHGEMVEPDEPESEATLEEPTEPRPVPAASIAGKRSRRQVNVIDDSLLWLINRQVFHPRGYALAYDSLTQKWWLYGDGTEPWVFGGDGSVEAPHLERIKELLP